MSSHATPPPTDYSILLAEDVASLEREGTLVKLPHSQSRMIHKRRLNRSSEEEYEHIQLPTPPSSSSPRTQFSEQDYNMIPEFLICRDTLCFFGFAAATADEIWGNWTDWGSDEEEDIDDGPGGFLNMATSWVDAKDIDAFTDDDDAWISAMSAYGIDEALQTVIMMPLYKDIRLTASCKELDYRYYRVTL